MSTTATTTAPAVFTPIGLKGRRMRFNRDAVTVVSGTPFTSGRGVRGRVEIAGAQFDVVGQSCGASCFCDAKLVAA